MSDPGNFREIARTVRIDYPIPYVSVVLAALALGCFGWATIQTAPISWVTEGLGVFAGLAALALPIYAVLRRPDLLRSERHSLVSRAIDIMLDKQASQKARVQAGQIVESALLAEVSAEKVPHPWTDGSRSTGTENGNERIDHE